MKKFVIKNDSNVILPKTKLRLIVSLELGKKLIDYIGEEVIHTMFDKDTKKHEEIGTLVRVDSSIRTNNKYYVDLYGIQRVKISNLELNEIDSFSYAEYEEFDIVDNLTKEESDLYLTYIKEEFSAIKDALNLPKPITRVVENSYDLRDIIGELFPLVPWDKETKQEILLEDTYKDLVEKFVEVYAIQVEEILFKLQVNNDFNNKNNEAYRKMMLQNQIKQAQEQLDEMNPNSVTKNKLEEQIENLVAPDYVKEHINAEYGRLKQMDSNNSEYQLTKKYIETILEIPWFSKKVDIDINLTKNLLNKKHYKMDDVKKRIIEHLAVMKLKDDKQGSIILLVGPPGTGKTSLASSVAEALNRPYVRASLGGVKDESEIRGHRRTYVGALPGKIISGMKKAKSNNPVFVLDEIDKLGNSYNGDPASAMLEVLDPEQNSTFVDHYLEIEYDLSQVFFIATANTTSTIPQPLLDRMEIIEISSYTSMEKYHIAKDYLIPASIYDHGLTEEIVKYDDDAIYKIINDYTREAGVRGLKKRIDEINRNMAFKVVSNEASKTTLTEELVSQTLGNKTVRHELIHNHSNPGIVTGLAYTPVGGDILFIESMFTKGTGKIKITGQLGDVMKESATIALSQVKKMLEDYIDIDFSKNDLHIHVPAGAIPKDGPSAGITLFSALSSLILNQPVSNKIAMTGEVNLNGDILPIGGLKEKSIAAHTSGIKTILISKENEKDLSDLPEEVINDIKFVIVKDTTDVLDYLFDLKKAYTINKEDKKDSSITT